MLKAASRSIQAGVLDDNLAPDEVLMMALMVASWGKMDELDRRVKELEEKKPTR